VEDRRRDGYRPRVLINRLDKENADFDAADGRPRVHLRPPQSAPSRSPWALRLFRGVIDVIRMKAYHHEGDREEVSTSPEFSGRREGPRDKLTELVAEADDDLMEKYLLEGERLTQEELETLLDKAIAQGIFIPVFVASATALQGVEDLLDEIVSFFPEPTAHGPIPTVDGGEREVSVEGGLSAFVFKTDVRSLRRTSELRQGRLGHPQAQYRAHQLRTGKKERIGHVSRWSARRLPTSKRSPQETSPSSQAWRHATGDTLSADGAVTFAPLPFPEPLYPVAIQAKTKADEDKLGTR
jgi:elongation factor G